MLLAMQLSLTSPLKTDRFPIFHSNQLPIPTPPPMPVPDYVVLRMNAKTNYIVFQNLLQKDAIIIHRVMLN